MKKWLRFNVVLMLGAAVIALWLVGSPIAYSKLAELTWTKVPCHVSSGHNHLFSYRQGDQVYLSWTRDFWMKGKTEKARTAEGVDEINDVCWVNPHNPERAVLRLDALTNWTNSTGRLASAALVLVAAWLITMFGQRKKAASVKQR